MKDFNLYFTEIYEKYIDDIYKYVYYKVNFNQNIAEDLTQEIFLAVYKSIPFFKSLSTEKTWVFKIARNKLNDYYREYYKNTIEWVELTEEVCSSVDLDEFYRDDNIYTMIEKKEIKNCFCKISEQYRNVLLMKYLDGYSVKEIARILNKSEKSIDNLLQRGKKKFIEVYSEYKE